MVDPPGDPTDPSIYNLEAKTAIRDEWDNLPNRLVQSSNYLPVPRLCSMLNLYLTQKPSDYSTN